MSYHTPQFFVKDYANVLFFLVDGTVVKGENNHTITTTMDLTTMGPMQIWPLSNNPNTHNLEDFVEGDVIQCGSNLIVFNPDGLDIPRGMSYHDNLTTFQTLMASPTHHATYEGNIDLHLFNVPRYIRSDLELNKFLPHYDEWFKNLVLHNQSSIDQGSASKVNHIIRRLLLSPEEVQNSFWFKREFARHFAPATFKAQRTFPSFCTEDFFINDLVAPLTFPHYSAQEPGQVAFQPIDPSYREADRQIRTKPGRYLNKFLDLDSDQVRKCVSIENGDKSVQLKFAKTVKEFTNVYLRGPSSCMSHSIDWYDASASTGRLPVSILANGDIEVAYLELDSGIIPARVLVVQSDMEMLDVYCNNDAMDGARGELLSQLRDAGYSYNSTALVGQKIERIPIDEGVFVCPYIDCGGLPVIDTGDYLQICHSDEGDMTADYQSGVCQNNRKYCQHCEESHDSDEQYVDDVGDVCEGCLNDDFTYARCGRSGEAYIHNDDVIYIQSMDESYFSSDDTLQYYSIYRCHITDEYYHTNDLVTCHVSDEYIHEDEAVHIGDSVYVSDEYAVYSDHLGHHLIENDAELITMDDSGTTDWFPDDEVVYSEYHQQSIPTCLASEIDGDHYWTSHLVCDEVGNYSLLDTNTPITLETAA